MGIRFRACLRKIMHRFDGESEVQEARKQRVELVEPRVDAPAARETSEQPLDLVPKLAEFAVAVPFDFPFRFRRHDRHHPQGLHKSAGLVALVGAVSIAGGAFRPYGPSFPAGRGLRARRGHAPGTNSQPLDWGILLQRFRGVFT